MLYTGSRAGCQDTEERAERKRTIVVLNVDRVETSIIRICSSRDALSFGGIARISSNSRSTTSLISPFDSSSAASYLPFLTYSVISGRGHHTGRAAFSMVASDRLPV